MQKSPQQTAPEGVAVTVAEGVTGTRVGMQKFRSRPLSAAQSPRHFEYEAPRCPRHSRRHALHRPGTAVGVRVIRGIAVIRCVTVGRGVGVIWMPVIVCLGKTMPVTGVVWGQAQPFVLIQCE
jgi:hypothetical protein